MRRLILASTALALWLAGPAHALDLARQSTIELERGGTIAAVGDVNGDGRGDFVSGDPAAFDEGFKGARGAARVVFGGSAPHGTDLDRLPGFTIVGAKPEDETGTKVAPAGDMNADGLADVVITTPRGENFSRRISKRTSLSIDGGAYVVFGSRSSATVDAGKLGTRGFVIRGLEDGDAAGAGDVNGDGRDDLILANPSFEEAYVVFGGSTANVADVGKLGRRGYTLEGASGDLSLGSDVDAAGDFNRDGLGDMVIGVPNSLARRRRASDYEPIGPGAAYIVLGARSGAPVALARTGGRVIRVDLPRGQFGTLGAAVTGAGDVNSDGFADVAVGASAFPVRLGRNFSFGPGAVFVVYGGTRAGRLRVGDGSAGELRIDGDQQLPGFGAALAPAGDMNADGRSDLLIGAPGDSEGPPTAPGAAYLVHGRGAGRLAVTAIARPGGPGLAMLGTPGDAAGASLAAPGDIDGDRRPDLLVAAPGTCGGATRNALDVEEGNHPGADVQGRGTIWGLTPGALRRPDPVLTGPGNDRFRGGPGGEIVRGFAGADLLSGGGGGDCLFGDAGRDRLSGGAAGDVLLGGGSPDRLIGGDASDYLEGGGGADRLDGGSGVDELHGGARSDRLSGGAAGDRLEGGGSGDRIRGGAGADDLQGGSGRDRLDGGSGRDSVDGGRGADRISGGTGRDYIYVRGGGRDRVRCGPARDVVEADRSDRLAGCEVKRLPRRRRR